MYTNAHARAIVGDEVTSLPHPRDLRYPRFLLTESTFHPRNPLISRFSRQKNSTTLPPTISLLNPAPLRADPERLLLSANSIGPTVKTVETVKRPSQVLDFPVYPPKLFKTYKGLQLAIPIPALALFAVNSQERALVSASNSKKLREIP